MSDGMDWIFHLVSNGMDWMFPPGVQWYGQDDSARCPMVWTGCFRPVFNGIDRMFPPGVMVMTGYFHPLSMVFDWIILTG